MSKKEPALYHFLKLSKGSWRNAFYIECAACPYGKGICGGCLLTAEADGSPFIIPAAYFEKVTGDMTDKSECAAAISREAFEVLYGQWLLWNITDPSKCSILQLIPKPDGST